MRRSTLNPNRFALLDRFFHESCDALGRMNLPLPQDRVQKAVSQAMPVVHAVVVPGHRVAGDQRMIDVSR